jgi:hypothetical protein
MIFGANGFPTTGLAFVTNEHHENRCAKQEKTQLLW